MGLVLFVFWVSRRFYNNKHKNIRENQKYKRKQKNTKTSTGKTKQNKVSKRFQTHPWIWVWSCLVSVFPRRFLKNGEIKIPRKSYFWLSRTCLGFLWFSYILLVFTNVFSFLLLNLLENQKIKQDEAHIQGWV